VHCRYSPTRQLRGVAIAATRRRLAYAKPHVRNSPDGTDSVRSSGPNPRFDLTTGRSNFGQDPIALRLRGAFQVPRNPGAPRNCAHGAPKR